MPVLKNPRHERIAQLLASGKTATEAHQLAGFPLALSGQKHAR
jgi:hypothetical protein